MPLADIVDLVFHPAVVPLWRDAVVPSPRVEDRIDALHRRLGELQQELRQQRAAGRRPGRRSGLPLAMWQRRAEEAARNADEAWRFARDDGVGHPEAARRLAVVERSGEWLADIERYDLAPERLAAMNPQDRATAEALLPQIRRTRQAVLNLLNTPEGVRQAAAEAGRLHTMLRAAYMGRELPRVDETAPTKEGSRYLAAEGATDVATGCIPCARGHLSAVAGTLAAAARSNSVTDEVAERVATASRELGALLEHDWTDEKIARNAPAEQEVLRTYRPRVQRLYEALQEARTPADVRAAAAQAQEIWGGFREATRSLAARPYGMIGRSGARDAAVPSAMLERFSRPAEAEVLAETRREDTARTFERLVRAAQACGVNVTTMALPTTETVQTNGLFVPETDTVELNGALFGLEFLGVQNPYAVQVLMHELAHALKDNLRCRPLESSLSPQQRAAIEDETHAATMIALIETGTPIIDNMGRLYPAGSRSVDWNLVRQEFSPEAVANIRFAVDWLRRAAEGDMSGLCEVRCPARPGVAALPLSTFAPATESPVRSGTVVAPPAGYAGELIDLDALQRRADKLRRASLELFEASKAANEPGSGMSQAESDRLLAESDRLLIRAFQVEDQIKRYKRMLGGRRMDVPPAGSSSGGPDEAMRLRARLLALLDQSAAAFKDWENVTEGSGIGTPQSQDALKRWIGVMNQLDDTYRRLLDLGPQPFVLVTVPPTDKGFAARAFTIGERLAARMNALQQEFLATYDDWLAASNAGDVATANERTEHLKKVNERLIQTVNEFRGLESQYGAKRLHELLKQFGVETYGL